MVRTLKRGLEKVLLGLLSLVPNSAMRQLFFAMRQRPDLTDRWGHHIRPIHYYEPLPDFRALRKTEIERQRISPAIDFRYEAQAELLQRLVSEYGTEVSELAIKTGDDGFDFQNPYFGTLDAALYYALIRDLKPKTVIEIGSGFSTRIAAKALARNETEGQLANLICVEPYPEPRLTGSSARFTLLKNKVQDVPIERFEALESGDILLIDSSHVATSGSDVLFEFFEVLPRLNCGVWVHVHDIFFPFDYPASWLIEKRIAFNEQYILEAFLSFNSAYEVQLNNAWVSRFCEDEARRMLPNLNGTSPSASFWMQRKT